MLRTFDVRRFPLAALVEAKGNTLTTISVCIPARDEAPTVGAIVEAIMTQAHLLNPLDAEYVEHREAEERHRETLQWLKRRERELVGSSWGEESQNRRRDVGEPAPVEVRTHERLPVDLEAAYIRVHVHQC